MAVLTLNPSPESLESGVGPVVYNNENGDIVLTVHFSDVGNAANA